jgi:hypothetical protein
MGQQVNIDSKLKKIFGGVENSNSKKVVKLSLLDPKPSDLTMNKLKNK